MVLFILGRKLFDFAILHRYYVTSFFCRSVPSKTVLLHKSRSVLSSSFGSVLKGNTFFERSLINNIKVHLQFTHERESIVLQLAFQGLKYGPRPVSGSVMGKAGGFYAVARGIKVGVYNSWDECKAQVNGFKNARYKKFPSLEEANAFIKENSGSSSTFFPLQSAPSTSGSATESVKKKFVVGSRSGTLTLTSGPSSTLLQPVPSRPQKRDLSSLKVTGDRVINKRAKLEDPNSHVDLKKFTVDSDGYVVVYTDGACTKNGKRAAKAGIGAWFGNDHPLNVSEPVTGRQTNNTAEIQAAEMAIRRAKQNGINKLNVKTDSQFTINCVTKWLPNWKRKNWKLSTGGDVKNKEDLVKLDETMQNMEIKWSYVAGHKGIEGNEAADRLAVAGAQRAK